MPYPLLHNKSYTAHGHPKFHTPTADPRSRDMVFNNLTMAVCKICLCTDLHTNRPELFIKATFHAAHEVDG